MQGIGSRARGSKIGLHLANLKILKGEVVDCNNIRG